MVQGHLKGPDLWLWACACPTPQLRFRPISMSQPQREPQSAQKRRFARPYHQGQKKGRGCISRPDLHTTLGDHVAYFWWYANGHFNWRTNFQLLKPLRGFPVMIVTLEHQQGETKHILKQMEAKRNPTRTNHFWGPRLRCNAI